MKAQRFIGAHVPAKHCQHPSHDLDLGSASSDGVQVLKVDRDKLCKFKGFNQVGALVRPPQERGLHSILPGPLRGPGWRVVLLWCG